MAENGRRSAGLDQAPLEVCPGLQRHGDSTSRLQGRSTSFAFPCVGPATNAVRRCLEGAAGEGLRAANVTLRAKITATRGAINEVAVIEANQWPQSSAEVQAWIKKHWKFVSTYSGTTVQQIFLKNPLSSTNGSGEPYKNVNIPMLSPARIPEGIVR